MRVVDVELGSGTLTAREVAAVGPIDLAVRDPGCQDALVFGCGPLSTLEVPGSHRLVVSGWSPLWAGRGISTIGSAALSLHALGLRALVLHGRAGPVGRPAALVLAGHPVRARVVEIDAEAAWHKRGAYGLLAAAARLLDEPARVLCVGPGARATRFGAIGSASAGSDVFDTWAGRGGFGTQLLGAHGLCALVLPAGERTRVGNFVPPDALEAATVKYRYDPRLKTGGTFGGNMASLREKLLCMNDRSIYWSPALREAAYERLVAGHYLAQFQGDMKGRRGRDCGETCPADCKKIDQGGHKKDFQPYQALGPNLGVFDQRAAEAVNDACDEWGLDAVELGGVVALLMEQSGCAHWDPENFDPVTDSEHNAKLACEIASQVARGGRGAAGVRALARSLAGAAGDAAVYVAHGEAGGMAPNQYWVPGILAPVAVGGRYYVDYSFEFAAPRELGRRCAERMVRELALDNLGLCRFQREWAEGRMDELARAARLEVDPLEHHRELARALDDAAAPRPWETARTRDLVKSYLDEVARDGRPDPALSAWRAGFAADRDAAAGAYWAELRAGIRERLEST
ncbi:MAG TPA: aldehyde ferredoxin oxidoreductase N-terminal domain-containing protein [Polyangia bacterium]|nr:aldehyde ferredoxin oxidoreductase N-terminal domain-containing protein [Polyangia bacterium]